MYVFQGTQARALKKTLDNIVDDPMDGFQARAMFPKIFDESTTTEAYVDDSEVGGPGLLQEKLEGQDVSMGTIYQGALTRYMVKTYALGLGVSEEALEDMQYDKVIRAAVRLKRAGWVTADTEAALSFVRATSTSFPIGDGLPLASASHVNPNGSTFSNTLAVPMSPSRTAVTIAATMISKFPGHDGIVGSSMYQGACIVCPIDQKWAWRVILGSAHAPEAGEFNAINVVNQDMKLDLYPWVFWNNTTTNWALKTDADNGFRFIWRRKFRSRTWVSNEQGIMKYSIDARWVRGCSDARALVFSNM